VIDQVWIFALQAAVVPPLIPLQLQSHEPLPTTEDTAPVAQREVVGIVLYVPPLLVPHKPLTGASVDAVNATAPVIMADCTEMSVSLKFVAMPL
jgi:hypothetical protein